MQRNQHGVLQHEPPSQLVKTHHTIWIDFEDGDKHERLFKDDELERGSAAA
jgi:hypothetical protein